MKRAMGWLLLTLLMLHAYLRMQEGLLPELLWSCHMASALLALGLILGLPALSAMGFLFHIAIAVPTYTLYLLSGGDTNWTSILLHTLSPVFGWLAWRRAPLPSATFWRTWGFYLVLLVVSRLFTPPNLNINLAFEPWAPLAFFGLWLSRIGNAMIMLVVLATAQWLLNRRFRNSANPTSLQSEKV